MIRTALIILILAFGICKGHAQTDPVLSGMIVLYTDKAEKQLKAQIYGFYHEIGKLTENMGALSRQLEKSPENALAVALTPRRSGIYRELILGSVDIVNDIRQVCLSNVKMTEKERIEIVFGIRPKLHLMNRNLRRLTLAVKYTSLSDVWREIDCRAKSYDVDKWKITDEAFSRWRSNSKIRPGK